MLKELNVENNEGRMMYLRFVKMFYKSNILPLMNFSIAYSASVGGLCTIIGNPPNLILNEFMNQQFTVKQSTPQDFIHKLGIMHGLQKCFYRRSSHLTSAPGCFFPSLVVSSTCSFSGLFSSSISSDPAWRSSLASVRQRPRRTTPGASRIWLKRDMRLTL